MVTQGFDDSWGEVERRLGGVPFPVSDGGRVNFKNLGRVALREAYLKSPLFDMLSPTLWILWNFRRWLS